MTARAYTVAGLASEWECSDELVYGLINAGRLRAWKLGGKLWRINRADVEDYECRQAIASAACEGNAATAAPIAITKSSGMTSEDRTASRLERMIDKPPRPQLVHSGRAERSPQPIQSAR